MIVKKPGREFRSTVDIVCPRCGAVLTIDARDVKMGSSTTNSTYFTFKCDWCKRKSVQKTNLLSDELKEEYYNFIERD